MGRCQSGFCSNRIVEILAEELGIKGMKLLSLVEIQKYYIRKTNLN